MKGEGRGNKGVEMLEIRCARTGWIGLVQGNRQDRQWCLTVAEAGGVAWSVG